MARIAWAVSLGIPHHITRREYRRHDSGNEYGVPGTWSPEPGQANQHRMIRAWETSPM